MGSFFASILANLNYTVQNALLENVRSRLSTKNAVLRSGEGLWETITWTGLPNFTLCRRLQWRDGSWGNQVLLTAKSNIWATMALPFFFSFKLGSARLSSKRPGHCIGDQCVLCLNPTLHGTQKF